MNKKNKIFVLVALVLLLTGCTEYKTYNNEPVVIDSTGQRVVENILCKTEETERQFNELKEKYKTDLDNKLNNSELSQEEYDQKINELIEKQMIFNNYLFLLDDLYNELISYKFNNIKSYN